MVSPNSAFIGIMSGTSLDGLDGVIASFDDGAIQIHAKASLAYPKAMQQGFQALFKPADNEIERMQTLAHERAILAKKLVVKLQSLAPEINITAIGDHGQTVRHYPNKPAPYTLQIHHGAMLAQLCGIDTVVDFRSKDIAAGGQGAPFAPIFHQAFFADKTQNRIIINIGGIANISHLAPLADSPVLGFDTGPGNTLMDGWCQRHQNTLFDESGKWARSGKINQALLNNLLEDDYFQLAPPKSTGREKFNLVWLDQKLAKSPALPPQDVQASLTAFTADTIAAGIQSLIHANKLSIYVCGGGANNVYLLQLLSSALGAPIQITDALGIAPQQVEAAGFAWLAKQTIEKQALDLRAITGANKPNILGVVYPA